MPISSTFKSKSALSRLATVTVATQAHRADNSTIKARPSSTRHSFRPVPSKNTSSTVAIPAIKSSIPLKQYPVKSSMPKKTQASIVNHVERIRKARNAQATYATVSAFKKPCAKSTPAPSRPASQPAFRTPSVSSTASTSVSAQPEDPVVALLDELLAEMEVAPLTLTKPVVPALRSCLKTAPSTSSKKVVFKPEWDDWNLHQFRAFQREDPPNTFILPEQADLIQPHYTYSNPQLVPEYSYPVPGYEYRYAPQEYVPTTQGVANPYEVFLKCSECAYSATVATPLATYYGKEHGEFTPCVWCEDCLDFNPSSAWPPRSDLQDI